MIFFSVESPCQNSEQIVVKMSANAVLTKMMNKLKPSKTI